MPKHEELVTLLEAARCEPIGIVLMTSDPSAARAVLYRARSRESNPEYADLQFRAWPYEEGNLIICHGQAKPASTNLGDIDLGGILNLDLDT